jgi:[ribosomal protein S18]-alanine N-acetyltransferase
MVPRDLSTVIEIQTAAGFPGWMEYDYNRLIGDAELFSFVCIFESEIAGFVAANLVDEHGVIEIYNIAVSRTQRRRGIGKLLVETLQVAVLEKERPKIWLELRASNSGAQRFYLTMGFVETGRRKNYYTTPVEDSVLMDWSPGQITNN